MIPPQNYFFFEPDANSLDAPFVLYMIALELCPEALNIG